MRKLSIVVVFVVILAGGFFIYYKEGTLPVNSKNKTTKIFVIRKGERVTAIAKNLEKEGLIRNKVVFYIIVKRLKIDNKLQAGDFRLSPSMDAYTIATSLTRGTLDVWVTIVEGLRREEIAQIFSKALDLPESEFLKRAQEGYLFPDTYLIPKDATIETVIKILTDNFNRKYTQELKNKTLQKGLTDQQVIALASFVEREARLDADRRLVASILYKRFKNDWPLQVDATIQYALGYQPLERSWWKKNLTADDLKIESPYNTYKNTGLPPTAIGNSGLAAIKAVIEADESTPFWYYLSDKEGKMHYATTIEEHNENVAKYLR